MARNNPKVSPEVAVELVDLARQMRRRLYGATEFRSGDEVFAD